MAWKPCHNVKGNRRFRKLTERLRVQIEAYNQWFLSLGLEPGFMVTRW
jgi:hypothetical protein